MTWLLFEVLLAFGVAVFIVWWTFPKKNPREAAGDKKADGKTDDGKHLNQKSGDAQ